jgi:hypothetical protein
MASSISNCGGRYRANEQDPVQGPSNHASVLLDRQSILDFAHRCEERAIDGLPYGNLATRFLRTGELKDGVGFVIADVMRPVSDADFLVGNCDREYRFGLHIRHDVPLWFKRPPRRLLMTSARDREIQISFVALSTVTPESC